MVHLSGLASRRPHIRVTRRSGSRRSITQPNSMMAIEKTKATGTT